MTALKQAIKEGKLGESISELVWMLLPAIALKQYRAWVRTGVPVSHACRSHLSGNAEVALKAGVRRAPAEAWASCPNPWLIAAAAPPFRGCDEVLATLKNKIFREQTVIPLQATLGEKGVEVMEW